jgi:F420-non-reducing hydrogenase iron-sulfur subunit
MKNLLEHMGIEPGRLHFSWISSAESTKFVEVAKQVTEEALALASKEKKYMKTKPKVA